MGLSTIHPIYFVHAGESVPIPCTVTYTSVTACYTISSPPMDWDERPSRAEIMQRTCRLIFGDIR